MRDLDEITFSIDGDNAEIHEGVRGRRTFARTLGNLRSAVRLGYNVQVTMCVHRGNIGRDASGRLILDRSVQWVEDLGATSMNFHPVFKMGIARDSWTGDVHISPSEWRPVYKELRANVKSGAYGISVRVPERFVSEREFSENPEYLGYCPVKLAERLEVHQNGQMHSCALHNGTPISVATFARTDRGLELTWSPNPNELSSYSFIDDRPHPCVVMRGFEGALQPLCISLKPEQDEFVWKRLRLFRRTSSRSLYSRDTFSRSLGPLLRS